MKKGSPRKEDSIGHSDPIVWSFFMIAGRALMLFGKTCLSCSHITRERCKIISLKRNRGGYNSASRKRIRAGICLPYAFSAVPRCFLHVCDSAAGCCLDCFDELTVLSDSTPIFCVLHGIVLNIIAFFAVCLVFRFFHSGGVHAFMPIWFVSVWLQAVLLCLVRH